MIPFFAGKSRQDGSFQVFKETGRPGPAVALAALALNFFWAQDRKARYCCCLLLYFGIGMIVTGVGGL